MVSQADVLQSAKGVEKFFLMLAANPLKIRLAHEITYLADFDEL